MLVKEINHQGGICTEGDQFALDIADEKPDGTIYLIPARLEDCEVPERLNRWQWVDLYEDNGFIKLLRSLKLRADAVSAVIEPEIYYEDDKGFESRLERIYTEGLAAFYTEEWDKACHCFQTILREQPGHLNASEKLAEAERQRNLANLYEQATKAVRTEEWGNAIQILETLSNQSANYEDAPQLLRIARNKKQLQKLYDEAKMLHAAQKWEAVVKVFGQITELDTKYTDPDDLLSSAQDEITLLNRKKELDDLYSLAVHKIDSGQLCEARDLLENIQQVEPGFRDTELILNRLVEEIEYQAEIRERERRIKDLYSQAHEFFLARKWQESLEVINQIYEIDADFFDLDRIVEQAQNELDVQQKIAKTEFRREAVVPVKPAKTPAVSKPNITLKSVGITLGISILVLPRGR
jgi:outer membrane protein assembly factor BamD (BamD/ComL family)